LCRKSCLVFVVPCSFSRSIDRLLIGFEFCWNTWSVCSVACLAETHKMDSRSRLRTKSSLHTAVLRMALAKRTSMPKSLFVTPADGSSAQDMLPPTIIEPSRPSTAASLQSAGSENTFAFEVTFEDGDEEENLRALFGSDPGPASRPESRSESRPGSRPSRGDALAPPAGYRRSRRRLSTLGRSIGWREIWHALEKDSIQRLQRMFSRGYELGREDFSRAVMSVLGNDNVRVAAAQVRLVWVCRNARQRITRVSCVNSCLIRSTPTGQALSGPFFNAFT
jgi:hypothetical protein